MFNPPPPHRPLTLALATLAQGSPKKTKSKKTKTQTTPTLTTLTLNDTEVSTNHATLSVKYFRKKNLILSSSLIIKDLNSSNGTFINGKKLEPKKTRAAFINDSVRFGASVCRIKNHLSPASTEAGLTTGT
ncbi:hypothetical protein TL16_g10020 [Triparma laevis f. inornata]|uniref:FHA domain-containing protein n=1 Tax=Triparma laevis f. inornata TaxID=1714386 RepID=A0A9W7EMM8_9STRA|nr:hypothetical protein TL16_g10020 [Triparma laevis f. inornata]